MGSDWVRLGTELASARKRADLTQEEMAERLGVSRSAIQTIERGASKRVTSTIRAYAQAVGWDDGSVRHVLAGNAPSSTKPEGPQAEPDEAAPETGAPPADLPLRVVRSLSEGRLIDTAVINLPTSGSDMRLTVVVRGNPDASPEEIMKALEAWERAERHLQHLDEDDDEAHSPR
ncbi:helix-turn-helix transcriptional regulator [Streptomyces albus]|uniref:helix-turn-helix transcriptional regulator n=1 Tax=Streptomyces albus TaxID=1888 RepID=UPI003879FB97